MLSARKNLKKTGCSLQNVGPTVLVRQFRTTPKLLDECATVLAGTNDASCPVQLRQGSLNLPTTRLRGALPHTLMLFWT